MGSGREVENVKGKRRHSERGRRKGMEKQDRREWRMGEGWRECKEGETGKRRDGRSPPY